ncbi:pogo transposable element with KRAB domain-like protein [Aphelenchoides avenae]|nr:pogo transposable element with KRAB domain-like protein [Aphelenchus avenae]
MSGSDPEAPAAAEAALAADTSKRKTFGNAFKLEVLEYAKRNRTKDGKPNKDGAAKHFGIDRKNPADVSWNKPFKALMQLYNHWMMHGEHEATAAGNPKPPPPEVYLEWVLEAWYDGVTKDNVVNSFKTCGITTALDGSEDHLIHCLKDGNGMPNGCYKLAQKREEAEAEDLAQLMAGFELDLDEDDVGNVSDAEIIEDHDEEGNNNEESESSDDSDF